MVAREVGRVKEPPGEPNLKEVMALPGLWYEARCHEERGEDVEFTFLTRLATLTTGTSPFTG